MRRPALFLLCALGLHVVACARATTVTPLTADPVVRDALLAESNLDTRRALDLFLTAEKSRPDDVFVLQKIARQYSDLMVDLPDDAAKKQSAERALAYAKRAVALAPRDAVNVLSLAVCHGKLALYGDTRAKVASSRLVKEEAERALALDPDYAWAHHVLGRWNSEVAALGTTSRFFVGLFYGGLPEASMAEAVRHLTRAVELEPGELAHQLELGFAHLASHQPTEARQCFTRGLAMPSRAKYDDEAKARARTALTALEATSH